MSYAITQGRGSALLRRNRNGQAVDLRARIRRRLPKLGTATAALRPAISVRSRSTRAAILHRTCRKALPPIHNPWRRMTSEPCSITCRFVRRTSSAYRWAASPRSISASGIPIERCPFAWPVAAMARSPRSKTASAMRRGDRAIHSPSDMPAFAEKYAYGPSRVQFENKDPRGFAEFKRMLAEHSALGSANTQLGVQRERPSLYALSRTCTASPFPRWFLPATRIGRACCRAS